MTLEDSMRQLFEYCEWQKLTKIVLKCLPNLKEKDFCNDVDYNMQLQEESEYARKVRRNELVVKKRNSTCLSDFRERVFGANPYEESMEGVLEQRSE